MITNIKNPFDLATIHEELKKLDHSIVFFRGYGVVNFYSVIHKYSISPTVDLEKGELLFELVVPNGFVGNEIFAGSPDQCIDWVRENLSNIISMSNFEGRVGTREEYLVSIGENPTEAVESEPEEIESEGDDAITAATIERKPGSKGISE